jgi:hypothetical protein
MNATMKRALCSVTTSTALVAGSFAIVPMAAAPAAAACQPFTYYKVSKLSGATYKSRGPVRSKYNSSSHKSTLSITVQTSTTRTSTWKVEGGGSLSWGIGQVEAKTSYEVAKSASKGVSVTNRMVVDAKKRGYTRPMVEYRRFVVDKWRETGNCKQVPVETMGVLTGITSTQHWAECQTKSTEGCTPKP